MHEGAVERRREAQGKVILSISCVIGCLLSARARREKESSTGEGDKRNHFAKEFREISHAGDPKHHLCFAGF
jgi:hypothetical protein